MNTLQSDVKPNKANTYSKTRKFKHRRNKVYQKTPANQTNTTVNPEEQSNSQNEVNPMQQETRQQQPPSSPNNPNPQKTQEHKPEHKPEQQKSEHKHQNKKYYRPNGSNKRFQHRDHKQRQHSQQLNLTNKSVTVVIPLRDEEDSLVELSVALKKVLDPLRCSWEVIFIDDGSTDSSYQKLQEIHRVNNRFKCLKFKRNYGKSAALQEGF